MFKKIRNALLGATVLYSVESEALKIGVIVPLQHKAMDSIVEGLRESVQKQLGDGVEIIVKNANGDAVLQKQIIQQLVHEGVEYLLPIGTTTSQMTVATAKSVPVICIAAMMSEADRIKAGENRVVVIQDEIEATHLLEFIRSHFPNLKRIGLIYGNSEKIFPEIEQAKNYCTKHNMQLNLQKVDTTSEVYQYSQMLSKESDCVVVLKDHMVVSGITGLVKNASKTGALVISMDDGSVQAGAHFGLGVGEKDIGVATGEVLSRIVKGEAMKEIGSVKLTNLSVFYNTDTFSKQQHVSADKLKQATLANGYTLSELSLSQKG